MFICICGNNSNIIVNIYLNMQHLLLFTAIKIYVATVQHEFFIRKKKARVKHLTLFYIREILIFLKEI